MCVSHIYNFITRAVTASKVEYLPLGPSLQHCCSMVKAGLGTNHLQRRFQLQTLS